MDHDLVHLYDAKLISSLGRLAVWTNHPQSSNTLAFLVAHWKGEFMPNVRSRVDMIMNWIAANARSFSYLLPDTVELAVYFCLAAYYVVELAQQA